MLLERCPWYVAGPMLGLLLVAFRAALNKPVGALDALADVPAKPAAMEAILAFNRGAGESAAS